MAEGILRIKITWLKMMKMFSFQRPATKPSVRLDECPPIRWVAEKPLGLRYICSKTPKKNIGTYNLLAQVGHFMIEEDTNTLEKVFARHYDQSLPHGFQMSNSCFGLAMVQHPHTFPLPVRCGISPLAVAAAGQGMSVPLLALSNLSTAFPLQTHHLHLAGFLWFLLFVLWGFMGDLVCKAGSVEGAVGPSVATRDSSLIGSPLRLLWAQPFASF
jgi:hypothetical protein